MTSIDMAYVILGALVFGFSLMFGVWILDTMIAEAPAELPTNPLNQAKAALISLDAGVALLIGLICLTTIILSFLVRSHPVFFAVSFIVTLLLIPASAVVGNVYDSLATTAEFASASNQLPYTYTLFTFLPHITCVFSAIIGIVMFGKAQNSGGNMYG